MGYIHSSNQVSAPKVTSAQPLPTDGVAHCCTTVLQNTACLEQDFTAAFGDRGGVRGEGQSQSHLSRTSVFLTCPQRAALGVGLGAPELRPDMASGVSRLEHPRQEQLVCRDHIGKGRTSQKPPIPGDGVSSFDCPAPKIVCLRALGSGPKFCTLLCPLRPQAQSCPQSSVKWEKRCP